MKSRATEEGRYSKVSRRMWVDESFQALSKPPPNAQSLWQRLLTGPELGCIPGLFSARLGGLADALGWSKEDTQRCWEEISAQGLAEADWSAGLVWIPKAIIHNEPPNPNVVTSWRLALCELPECELKRRAIAIIRGFLENLGPSWVNAFDSITSKGSPNGTGKQEAGDKKQEAGDKKQEEEYKHVELAPDAGVDSDKLTKAKAKREKLNSDINLVFQAWKEDTGHTNAKLDNNRSSRISARLTQGFTVDQLIQAIKNRKNDPWLMGITSDRVYDEIKTLLRDAAQVERLIALDFQRPGSELPGLPKRDNFKRDANGRILG